MHIRDARLLFQSYVPITRDSMLSYVIAILVFFLRPWTTRAKNNITEKGKKAVRR